MSVTGLADRVLRWGLLAAAAALLAGHAAGWVAAVAAAVPRLAVFAPRLPSAVTLALAVVVLRVDRANRLTRRRVVAVVLLLAAVALGTLALPARVGEHGIMPGGADTASSRQVFESRFRAAGGVVSFHSHLGDVAMTALDRALGRDAQSPGRAYDLLSRLAGLVFLIELAVAGAWHRWSRHVCRYIALALATPSTLLYFGYWELGYLSIAAGVVPLLVPSRARHGTAAEAAPLLAGCLQGLHTAFHGFGLLAMAGAALRPLGTRGPWATRLVRALAFTSGAVALYLGWVFIYLAVAQVSLEWAREIGSRPWRLPTVIDNRVALPLLSLDGLGEFGLFSLLSGVPLLALALPGARAAALTPALLQALPGLVFQIRWWPVSAPFNLDLLLAAFPGLFAAEWLLAGSRRRTALALALLAGIHIVLWLTLGNGLFARAWVGDPS